MSKYVMDIESTGLNIFKDDIIEICVMKFDNNYIMGDTFSQLLKPKKRLSNKIIKLTGITEEMLNDKVYFSEVKRNLQCFIRSNPIYIYSSFEDRFLTKRYGFKNKFIDVLSIVKRRFPYLKNYKLITVLNRFGIKPEVSHRAGGDVMSLSWLMRELRL